MIVDRSFLLQLEILSSPLQSQQVYLVLSWICYLRIFISHHTIFVKIWRFMIMFWLKLIFNGEGYWIEKRLKPLLLSGEIEWTFRMFFSFKCDTLYGFPKSFFKSHQSRKVKYSIHSNGTNYLFEFFVKKAN